MLCLYITRQLCIQVLEASLKPDVDEAGRDAVTRVILTRADVDMKQINEEYHRKTGATLAQKIGEMANGNYRDFLVALVEKEK